MENTKDNTTVTIQEKIGIVFTQESANPSNALGILQSFEVELYHIESRESTTCPGCYDFIVLCQSQSTGYQSAIDQLKKTVKSLEICKDGVGDKVPLFPKHVSELDKFSNKILSCGKELDAEHPGFTDKVYRDRRQYFADIAINYKHGHPIPRVEYTEDETNTWKDIYTTMESLYPTKACTEFNDGFQLLKEKCRFGPDEIPQFEDISNFLRDRTGFTLRPVAGLLSIRNFLAGFAFRVFHATQYVRHGSQPRYTPEPDVCHELLGHVPMFADPDFAQFTQELGLASLGAPKEYVKRLGRLFWFTVEFGLCRQGNDIKVYGAGLLSSFGEIQHCQTEEPDKREFDPIKAAEQTFPLTKYQPIYYVADSFQSAKEKMRTYAARNPRSFNIQYNPFTHSIEVINTPKGVMDLVKKLHGEATLLEDTLTKVKSFRE